MIGDRIRKALRKRRKGAVALLAVVSMIPVTAMFASSMNGGQMIEDRRTTQDAADALALMHGTWAARSMNIIAMNNVAATQMTTVAIGSEALAGTLQELRIFAGLSLGYIGGHAAANCPPRSPNPIAAAVEAIIWTPFCAGVHAGVSVPALLALWRAAVVDYKYSPSHGIDVSHKALEAIEGMNRALIERFPSSMAKIGKEYADTLGIDDFHFAEPCKGGLGEDCDSGVSRDGMSLPLEEGGLTARANFCAAMNFGMTTKHSTYLTRGFNLGEGPMFFGGSSSNKHVRDHINAETDIGRHLRKFKNYYKSRWSNLVQYFVYIPTVRHPQALNLFGDQQDRQSGNGDMLYNSFARRFTAKEASVCLAGQSFTGPVNALIRYEIEAEMPTFWKLVGHEPLDPLPPVEAEEMDDAFRILAFTQMEKSRRLASTVLTDSVVQHYGYAQTGLFNPDGASIFSQNWRYKLMDASRMDDPNNVADGLDDDAPATFGHLANMLRAVSPGDPTWERVHAH